MNSPIRILVVGGEVSDGPQSIDESAVFSSSGEKDSQSFELVFAGDRDEALAAFQTDDIDCVVVGDGSDDVDTGDGSNNVDTGDGSNDEDTDSGLSDGDNASDHNGLAVLERVREIDDVVPLLYCRGTNGAPPEEALEAGATDCFSETLTDLLDREASFVARVQTAVDAAAHRRQERTDRYRTLLDSAPLPMLVLDDDDAIQYVNEQAVEAAGADAVDDLLGQDILSFVPPEERDRARERIDAVFEMREPVKIHEYAVFDLNGDDRYVRGSIVPTRFDGSPAVQLVLEDITEQRRHEERVKKQRRQIERLHDVGVELASCKSEQEVYELMVETAEDILDLDLCVADSVTDGRLTIEATSTELTEYDEAPVASGDAGIAGKAYLNDTSYLIRDARDHPDAEPAGEYRSGITVPIGDYGVFQAAAREVEAFDHTDLELVEILVGHVREALTRLEQERKLREQRDELTRENERLDEFTSIVSHDLRNPLNVANLRLDLLAEECDSPHLAPMERAIERMGTLIEDLLTLAREGKAVSEFEVVNLADIARGSWTSVETGDATLVVETEATVLADESRFQQLLENLVRNAVEHGSDEEDITVTVGTLPPDGFYVADDGRGIPDDVRERLFEPGVTTDTDGSGLGLAIVSRIAEAHGWTVAVTDAEGGGARFEFSDVALVDDASR